MTVHLTNLRGKGLQEWGDAAGLSKGNGYDYFQSASESDYITNLDSAVSGGYNLVFGIGFALESAIKEVAPNNPDTHYVIVDSVVADEDNVVSVGFAQTMKLLTLLVLRLLNQLKRNKLVLSVV